MPPAIAPPRDRGRAVTERWTRRSCARGEAGARHVHEESEPGRALPQGQSDGTRRRAAGRRDGAAGQAARLEPRGDVHRPRCVGSSGEPTGSRPSPCGREEGALRCGDHLACGSALSLAPRDGEHAGRVERARRGVRVRDGDLRQHDAARSAVDARYVGVRGVRAFADRRERPSAHSSSRFTESPSHPGTRSTLPAIPVAART